MTTLFKSLIDDEEIRQGDIIKKRGEGSTSPTYGFILTADCDIAQSKAKNHFTWLEIVTVENYLEKVWSTEHKQVFIAKHAKLAAEQLTAALKKVSPELSALEKNGVVAWIEESGAADIINKIYSREISEDDISKKLKAIELLLKNTEQKSEIERLTMAYELVGSSKDTLYGEAKKSLSSGGGFPDYFQVPELPSTSGYGFVVLLRHIQSINGSSIFTSEATARINDKPNDFFRIGRFSDGIRFAVSQKLSFLFSRIGMHPSFERDCSESLNIALDELFKKETN